MTNDHHDDHDRDHDRDDAPALPERDVLAAWHVPAPAAGLTDRVLARVDAALPLGSVVALPAASPRRRGTGLVVVGVAMLAAAALVLGVAQSWRRPSAAEPISAAVAAPPASDGTPAMVPAAEGPSPAERGPTPTPTPTPTRGQADAPAPAVAPPHDLDDPFPRVEEPTRIASIGLKDPFAGAVPPSERPPLEPSEGGPDLRNPFDRSGDEARTRAAADSVSPELAGVLIDPPSDDAAKTVTLRIGTTKGQAWATVFIDGARIGATPVKSAKVTPGRHTVRWEWADGSASELVIEVEDGETRTIKAPPPAAPPSSP